MKLAFIGGNGHHYLKGALQDESIAITALAAASDGADPAGAKRNAENLGISEFFDDTSKMLDSFKPDVVSVGAIYAHNGDCVAACLKRDIPVVSDKPIAGTWEQLAMLRELAAGTNRVIVTEFDFRSRPEFRAARKAVQDGLLGEIVLATAQKSYRFGERRPDWYADRKQYTGTILWVAGHGIDAIRFATGLKYTRVFGKHGNIAKPDYGDMEDHTANLFELENAATGIVHADFLRAAKAPTHGDDRLRLIGSKGQLEVRDGRCRLATHEQEETDITDTVKTQPIHREILAALRGENSDLYGTAQSLEMATVMLAARDAADGQKLVDIQYG